MGLLGLGRKLGWCDVGLAEEEYEKNEVRGVYECRYIETWKSGAAVRGGAVNEEKGDKQDKAGDKLDNLGEGDDNLCSEANLVEGGGVVGVHEYMDKGVEPHAVDGESDVEVEPAPNLEHDRGVVPDMEGGERF